MLGRSIWDLEAGDVFAPIEYELTSYICAVYAHGVESEFEGFYSSESDFGRQLRPPTLVHVDKTRLLTLNCPEGTGPHARVHVEYYSRQHSPAYVGEQIKATGRIVDRYERKGRIYLDYDIEVRTSDGRLVTTYTDKILFASGEKSEEKAPAGQQQTKAASPTLPVEEPPAIRISDRILAPGDLVEGADIAGPSRAMTAQRMRWYGDGLESAIAGEPRSVGVTIHTDPEYARAQGLPGIIADGMQGTNWISNMLVKQFGMDYIGRGELRTKFIKPVFEKTLITPRAQVRSIQRLEDDSTVYVMDVWCEDQKGVKRTAGDAKVTTGPTRG